MPRKQFPPKREYSQKRTPKSGSLQKGKDKSLAKGLRLPKDKESNRGEPAAETFASLLRPLVVEPSNPQSPVILQSSPLAHLDTGKNSRSRIRPLPCSGRISGYLATLNQLLHHPNHATTGPHQNAKQSSRAILSTSCLTIGHYAPRKSSLWNHPWSPRNMAGFLNFCRKKLANLHSSCWPII